MASDTTSIPRIRRPLAMAGGLLALASLAAPLQQSGATFTSRTVNPSGGITAAPDWTPPVVDLAGLDAIRTGATITATASDAETGVRDVVFSWAPTGTQTWKPICTATASPYRCTNVSTVGMTAEVDIRAVATDHAGYRATDVVEGVTVDNAAPTVSFGTVPQTLSGLVVIPMNATDVDTEVVSVTLRVRPVGGTWTEVCTDATSPYSCGWDTTKGPGGSYELQATATDSAGNVGTATITRTVDNTVASVAVVQPATWLRGTVSIDAVASSTSPITSVTIQYSRNGTNGWTTLCTDTTSPYGCPLVTTSLADGAIWFRASLLSGTKTTDSALVGPVYIDNSAFRGHDVQAANGAGTAGRPDAGDTITLTYNRLLNPGTVLSGWTGAPQAVTLRLRDGQSLGLTGTDDSVDVLSGNQAVNLGSVNLRTDQIKRRATATFAGTIALGTTTVNGQQASVVTVTFGAQQTGRSQELRTSSILPTMAWTPSAAARDTTNVAASTAPVTETGAQDRDL